MKLHNRITNVICDAEAREDGIYLKVDWGDGEKWHKYGLGCLGDNWEYCVEPAEPLIKDEKIRKAVRAWAEANGVSEVMVVHPSFDTTALASISDPYKQISFSNERAFLQKDKAYTIDELCGEGEE